MTGSVVFWGALAVLLFWSVGAYNRLIRLRAAVIAAFAAIDEPFKHHIDLVKTGFQQPNDNGFAATKETGPDHPFFLLAGLRGAAEQFDACLKAARSQPLAAPAMSALQTAHQTMHVAWSRVQNRPHDLAGSLLPEPLPARWHHICANADIACAEFNRQVLSYNDAIAQFPAALLAWLFGFVAAKSV